jgi:hypothetical protein
MAIIPCKF